VPEFQPIYQQAVSIGYIDNVPPIPTRSTPSPTPTLLENYKLD
jgi:hypothetical protein